MSSVKFVIALLSIISVSKAAPQDRFEDIIEPVSMEYSPLNYRGRPEFAPMADRVEYYSNQQLEQVESGTEVNENQDDTIDDDSKNSKDDNKSSSDSDNTQTTTSEAKAEVTTIIDDDGMELFCTRRSKSKQSDSHSATSDHKTTNLTSSASLNSTPITSSELLSTSPISSQLSEEYKQNDLQDHINKVVCETNKRRKENNLPALQISQDLNEISQKHSVHQNKISKTTHDDPEGSLGSRMAKRGISWTFGAENVAGGFTDPVKAVQAWMDSPGHKANILNKKITYIGVGQDGKYWTQNFAGFKKTDKTIIYSPKC
ncbi:hypothetical protein BB561_005046 [Smittium simulii]|uniref:SCP domain-containing protein n=1 Tax=Smittium simulii TaxID=133385 RepID=A0A2T9YCI8_9FUNG|nr:hypothetical protein BB561_005046 [Smittium simulii]